MRYYTFELQFCYLLFFLSSHWLLFYLLHFCQVGEITKIMKAYINMIVKKRCSVKSVSSYGTNWIRWYAGDGRRKPISCKTDAERRWRCMKRNNLGSCYKAFKLTIAYAIQKSPWYYPNVLLTEILNVYPLGSPWCCFLPCNLQTTFERYTGHYTFPKKQKKSGIFFMDFI